MHFVRKVAWSANDVKLLEIEKTKNLSSTPLLFQKARIFLMLLGNISATPPQPKSLLICFYH